MGAVSISVALCCLAAEKSRGLARETAEAFLLLFKGVNAENCQQAQVPFLYCLGAVAYRPGVKQVQGLLLLHFMICHSNKCHSAGAIPVQWQGRWG